MKLLLDANLSWRLTTVLSEHFGECTHVNKVELPKPAKDIEIWNFAAIHGYTIITQDSDWRKVIARSLKLYSVPLANTWVPSP